MTRPKVLLIVGYFDWFSGYQEIGLARALRHLADVSVLASDRVNPMFSDEHLARLQISRRYQPGVTIEQGVRILRCRTRETRSMVWSQHAIRAVGAGDFDHIIQVMPGQVLPLAASLASTKATRSVLYGDNSAMYARLSPGAARLKSIAFALSKGCLYRFVNSQADAIYGYTPETLTRLKPFAAGHQMRLLPLTYDESVFFPDEALRAKTRSDYGWGGDAFVVIAPGKVQPQKRFELLLEPLRAAHAAGHEMRLVYVGLDDSPASEQLRRDVKGAGLETFVTLLPFCDPQTLNALFNAADIGVWPAMPAITIQQSMGTGLRVLIPDNDLVRHLVTTDQSGARFTNSAPDALSNAIAREVEAPAGDRNERAAHNRWLSSMNIAGQLLSLRESAGA